MRRIIRRSSDRVLPTRRSAQSPLAVSVVSVNGGNFWPNVQMGLVGLGA